MNRRFFIRNTSLIAAAAATLDVPVLGAKTEVEQFNTSANIRFGICTDLHYDIMPDGLDRIKAFVSTMNAEKADFIIQMGDFCKCYDYNRPLLDEWNKFNGPRYHVIGNHDMDGGFTEEQVVEFWKSDGRYYSFDVKGYHFIILDGNEGKRTDCRRYPSTLSNTQLAWLEKDLDQTSLPVIVFIHQGLDSDSGVQNATKVRYILQEANIKYGRQKVHVVFSGHHHKDYHNVINGIHYIQINSMSNHFLGKNYKAASYPPDILTKYPKLWEVTPYRDPLWAKIDIAPDGTFTLIGQKSTFIGPSPKERGVSRFKDIYPAVPYVSDRKFNLLFT
ncbi:alkaline phosphatase [Sphingobacterium sp. SGG-5]|uniref:metallophosphoesterase family protein n=1 Tax=Sphingobacterium sp. SGG-5 TaxID=2710881 RepID=UPI0013EB3F34|nr:metallophosphoesterase [Sphingobacterium sp. SGG-5]NGM63218.1 alkaline phosphatase [Sphingobacterium sp. SGG-5]